MHARVILGVGKGVLFREVSSVQECPHIYRERGSTVYSSYIMYIASVFLRLFNIRIVVGEREGLAF